MSDTVVKFDPEWCCWATGGWQDAAEGSVRDARRFTRAQAHTDFQRVTGEPWSDVRVWKRYIRPTTRQEKYEWWVENSTDEGWDNHPDEPPAEWDQDGGWYDDMPYWQFVHRSHPDAVPVWICGFKNDDPPANPEAPVDPA